MADKIKKSVYEVTFRHTAFKGESDTDVSVIAGDFEEAHKKAKDNSAIASKGKDDPVEIVGVRLLAVIDVE